MNNDLMELRALDDVQEQEHEPEQGLTRIMVVQQLPIIEEHLQVVKKELLAMTSEAMQMACTEQTYKDVKQIKAEINKRYEELEAQRKDVKRAVMAPYEKLEATYKDCVTTPVKECVSNLDAKIREVTDGLKQQKEDKAKAYFEELRQALGIDFVRYEQIGLVAKMASSEKSLKAQVKAFFDRIQADLAMIDTQDYKDEILYEYKRSLNAPSAVTTVLQRHWAIDEDIRRREAEQARNAAMQEAEQKVAEVIESDVQQNEPAFSPPTAIPQEASPIEEAPPVVKVYEAAFRVRGSMEQMKALKKFLKEGGYEYEQLKS